MPSKFYAANGSESDSVAGGAQADSNKENKGSFPEDPGITDHRIPDGGGPADGFIDEKGHDSGKGFLNQVNDGEKGITRSSGDSGERESKG
jgi:hypothetical protein